MQSGKNVAESVKESAANAAASAKAGMEKAKAVAQEKAERMKTRNPAEKETATMKKEEKKTQAQLNQEQAHLHNEEAKRMAQSGAHPGYKTRGATTAATDAPLTGSEEFSAFGTEDYMTPPGTTTTATAATVGDPRQTGGLVSTDAARFDSGTGAHR
ncbi:hypothetical protein LWI28_026929 [Acer negundo]|uniref:Uncharacterized protein n=1 Tax=Acer negundo TaxID=4023 RepID=A0AAD5I7N3_ACENE|nr:hypothetical protein LWI28_026929 [Acer negundo]KAK4834278.1 hypothetical protein QYF36_020162 [Acer negundo]